MHLEKFQPTCRMLGLFLGCSLPRAIHNTSNAKCAQVRELRTACSITSEDYYTIPCTTQVSCILCRLAQYHVYYSQESSRILNVRISIYCIASLRIKPLSLWICVSSAPMPKASAAQLVIASDRHLEYPGLDLNTLQPILSSQLSAKVIKTIKTETCTTPILNCSFHILNKIKSMSGQQLSISQSLIREFFNIVIMLCSDTESDESTDNFKLETMTPFFLSPPT